MITKLDLPQQLRHERKFTLSDFPRQEVVRLIKHHPAFFRPIFYPRQINNIYLDTPDFKFYKDNVKGISERKKVRIRWYGETFGEAQRPRLEYKLKEGLLGDKWIFPLPNFDIKQGFSIADLQALWQRANLPEAIRKDLELLHPSLLNTYQRTYFQSADKDFRLTLDENLSYYRVNNRANLFLTKRTDSEALIVELKYAPEVDNVANKISKLFPYRLDKSSKYVNGIEAFR